MRRGQTRPEPHTKPHAGDQRQRFSGAGEVQRYTERLSQACRKPHRHQAARQRRPSSGTSLSAGARTGGSRTPSRRPRPASTQTSRRLWRPWPRFDGRPRQGIRSDRRSRLRPQERRHDATMARPLPRYTNPHPTPKPGPASPRHSHHQHQTHREHRHTAYRATARRTQPHQTRRAHRYAPQRANKRRTGRPPRGTTAATTNE